MYKLVESPRYIPEVNVTLWDNYAEIKEIIIKNCCNMLIIFTIQMGRWYIRNKLPNVNILIINISFIIVV